MGVASVAAKELMVEIQPIQKLAIAQEKMTQQILYT